MRSLFLHHYSGDYGRIIDIVNDGRMSAFGNESIAISYYYWNERGR